MNTLFMHRVDFAGASQGFLTRPNQSHGCKEPGGKPVIFQLAQGKPRARHQFYKCLQANALDQGIRLRSKPMHLSQGHGKARLSKKSRGKARLLKNALR
jgi:hypothetical protein